MSRTALKLAEKIRQTGRRSPQELIPLIEQADQLAADSSDPYTKGVCVRAAGNAHQLLNNFSAALERYDTAIELFETAQESSQVGRTLLAKVGILFYLSRFDELFECARRARTLFEDSGEEASLARLDVNLGQAYHRLDQYPEALECYERAFPILDRVGDREGLLASSLNAGVALTALHQFTRADKRYDKALALAEELDMSSIGLQTRYNRTYLDFLKGNSGRALRGMFALKQEFGQEADDHHVCLCWLDETEILLEIGDLPESIHSARQARDLGRKLGLNYQVGKSLLFEAVAAIRLGDDEEVGRLLADAGRRFETEGNSVWTAVSKLQAALFRGERYEPQALGEAASARALLEGRCLPDRLAMADIVIGRIQRKMGDTICAIDSFESATKLAEESDSDWMRFHAYYELGVSLSDSDDQRSVESLAKAELMLDSLWHRIGSDDLKMAFLTDRENVYTHLVKDVAPTSAPAAFRLSERARSRVLVERLSRAGERRNFETLSDRLDADETVLEYFIAGEDLYTFVVNQGHLECVHQPNVVRSLTAEWDHLERHFSSCSVTFERLSRIIHHLERTANTHLRQLYKTLIEPVRDRIKKKITIVPHGFLHSIPFHSLHDGESFLCENHTLAYSPSATLYVSETRDVAPEPPLFIAFSTNKNEEIVDEVRQAASNFSDSVVLVNPNVYELGEHLEHYRELIHVAGHAGIDPVQGSLSWLETSEGRLTSRDLIDMQLRAGTIVVTGCHTARRVISAGDEWQGLMRAFYLSGAHTIVSAFWAIRDESARSFSSDFYRLYDGTNGPEAVRAAADSIRSTSPHPYFWGGFGTFVRKRGKTPYA